MRSVGLAHVSLVGVVMRLRMRYSSEHMVLSQ